MTRKKIGRPKSENPRDKSLNLRLRQSELDLIEKCSCKLNLSRTDTIMKGITMIEDSLKK